MSACLSRFEHLHVTVHSNADQVSETRQAAVVLFELIQRFVELFEAILSVGHGVTANLTRMMRLQVRGVNNSGPVGVGPSDGRDETRGG